MDNENSGYNGARPAEGKALMGELQGNTGQVGGDPTRRKAGVYEHKTAKNPDGTPVQLITQHDALLGDGQSRAAERSGFVYVRDVEPGEVKTLGMASAQQGKSEDLKGVLARLNALEAENATLKNQVTSGTAVPGTEPVVGSDATKQAAADKTAEQTGVQVDPATGSEQSNNPSFAQLQAEAKALGVNAKGSKEELTQRIADAKAEKVNE